MNSYVNKRLAELKAGWARIDATSPKKPVKRQVGYLPPRNAVEMVNFLLAGLEHAQKRTEAGDEQGAFAAFEKMRNVLVDFLPRR